MLVHLSRCVAVCLLGTVLLGTGLLKTTQTLSAADYILTIGGGYSPMGNQVSLEKNVVYFQRVLEQFYPKQVEHTIFFADGNDPARDLQFRPHETSMSKARETVAHIFGQTRYLYDQYRNHELERVDGPSSRKELEDWFTKMAKKLGDDDRVLIYVTAHGGKAANKKTPYDTKLYLWNNQSISMRDFTKQLDRLPPHVPVTVVMVQCYAGGFSHLIYRGGDPKLGVAPHARCGFYATVHTRGAAGCTSDIKEENYHEYSTYFWAAISGTTRTGEPATGADIDGNGLVSFVEAHAYALRESITIDISVKTSDVLLRQFSKLGDAKHPDWYSADTAFDQLIESARPTERSVALTLSHELGLTSAKRAAEARALAKKLEQKKKQVAQATGKLSMQRRRAASALRKTLQQRWPEFSNPWHSRVAEVLTRHSDEVMKLLNSRPELAQLGKLTRQIKQKTDQRSELDRRWVKCQRLIRCLENIALEHNLPLIATSDEQQSYARLVDLESQSLGSESEL